MKRVLAALITTLTVAACGGASSPTSPSPAESGPAPTATTAVIHGTVGGGTSASLFETTNGAGAGMTVTVQGTTITTTVIGAGQFQLANVPAGTTVLVFNGVGANAQLNIGQLLAGQTVTIKVVINGVDDATLEDKIQGSDREIEGRIESITGSTLKVAGRTVTIGASTVIRHGETTMTVSQLAVGQRVHVKGTITGTGETATTAATLILVQNMNTSIGVNLQGTVSGLSGTAAAFQFVVDGRTVKGTTATEFKGGKSPSFTELANGGQVHVKGSQQNGFVQAESITLQGK
jgi:hypothetical protein